MTLFPLTPTGKLRVPPRCNQCAGVRSSIECQVIKGMPGGRKGLQVYLCWLCATELGRSLLRDVSAVTQSDVKCEFTGKVEAQIDLESTEQTIKESFGQSGIDTFRLSLKQNI